MPTHTLGFPLLFVFLYSTCQLIDYIPHLFIPFTVYLLQLSVNSVRGRESCLLYIPSIYNSVLHIARPRWTYAEYMNEGMIGWTGYSASSWAQPTGFPQAHLSFTICYFLAWNPYSGHCGLLLLPTFFPIFVPFLHCTLHLEALFHPSDLSIFSVSRLNSHLLWETMPC